MDGTTKRAAKDQDQRVRVNSLTIDPANPRVHGERNMAAIKASLTEFGQDLPLLVRKEGRVVIAGNGRLQAMRELGWKTCSVRFVDYDQEQAIRRGLIDNRTSDLAGWDPVKLQALLDDLDARGAAMPETVAWSPVEIRELVAAFDRTSNTTVQEGSIPEAPEPISKFGDVWRLGDHTILCGDATKPESYGRVLEDALVDLIVTDPPYGVSYADKNAFLNAIGKGNLVQTPMQGDHDGAEHTAEKLWGPTFKNLYAFARKGAAFYCFSPQGGDLMMMMMMMMKANFNPAMHQLVWLKNNHVLGRVDYAHKHEPIIYTWKESGHRFHGDFQTSVLEYDRPHSSEHHPTMKPLALIAKLIENSSLKGQLVLDPFLGSGTTLLACEQLGRTCAGIEIEPRYVDVAIARWEALTGKKASKVEP